MNRHITGTVSLVVTGLLAACFAAPLHADADVPAGPLDALPALDLAGRELLFDEPFDTLSVSPYRARGEDTRWTAHTPWHGDFGDAVFTDPDPIAGFPFRTAQGMVRIEARRDSEGTWRSGLLTTADPEGGGFKATAGYFEARMRLPPGEGVWPAFWLGSRTGADGLSGEIDVIEFYGHSPSTFQAAWHVWDKDEASGETNQREHGLATFGPEHGMPADLTDDWHTWGVDVGAREIVFYFDRRALWRVPRPPEMDGVEFFPLVNLALGSGFPTERTPDPSYLYVDRVSVHAPAE